MNDFNRRYLNPHINNHRPCFFPETITDAKGKQRKTYPYNNVMTPYEKLKLLPHSEHCLKPGLSFAILDTVAYETSDNLTAKQLQKHVNNLLKPFMNKAGAA
jgi:hypothetical protein